MNQSVIIMIVIALIVTIVLIDMIYRHSKKSTNKESFTVGSIDQPNPFSSQFFYALSDHELAAQPWKFSSNTLQNSGNNGVEFSNSSGNAHSSHIGWGPNGDVYLRSVNNGGKVVVQDTGGNVGIGTANPQQKLSVAGGDLGIWGGKIQFLDSNGNDETDPYSLQKVCSSWDNCNLNLTLNDNWNESLQIYGSSCALGDCGGAGAMQHKFQADGTTYHMGNLQANGVTMGTDAGPNRGNGYVEIYPGQGGNLSYIDFHNQPFQQGANFNYMDGVDFSSRLINYGSANQGQGNLTVHSNSFNVQNAANPATGTVGIGQVSLQNTGSNLNLNGVNTLQLPDNVQLCIGDTCINKSTLGVLTGDTMCTIWNPAAGANLQASLNMNWWGGPLARFANSNRGQWEQMRISPCGNTASSGWCNPPSGNPSGNN